MKESYRRRNSEPSWPQPCEGGGNDALEALDRGMCRLGIPEVDELRNSQNQRRRRCQANRKAILWRALPRLCVAGRAESQTPGTHRNWGPSGHARTERPGGHPWPQGGGSVGEGEEL